MDRDTLDRAHAWIVSRDTGASSKTLWARMMGARRDDPSHPWDPDDLGRCLRLLELIPEWKPRIREMAGVSLGWAALVLRWDEIAQSMADEVGIDWSKGLSAPKTYALMKDTLKDALA